MRQIAFPAFILAAALATAARADLAPCGKNHYILEEPCGAVATEAAIGAPNGLVVSPTGDVYFSSQNAVFRVNGAGMLQRVAGTGEAGFSGDGGSALRARLNFPLQLEDIDPDFGYDGTIAALALDASGHLYIVDPYNNRVRRVDARDGTISTYAEIDWPRGIAFDSAGALYVTAGLSSLLRAPRAGEAMVEVAAWPLLQTAMGIAMGPDGNVYVAENCSVKRVSPRGLISVALQGCLWGGLQGVASVAGWLVNPAGVAVDRQGNLYVADPVNNCVRRKEPSGAVGSIGRCARLPSLLSAPKAVAVDLDGNLFIADTGNNRVLRVYSDGSVETIAGNGLPLELDRD